MVTNNANTQALSVRNSLNLTNSDRKRQHGKIQNDLDYDPIDLPGNYTAFKTFHSRLYDKEMIDIPQFYSKTPLLAHTVMFSLSEIELLESNSSLLSDFNRKQQQHLEKLYQ